MKSKSPRRRKTTIYQTTNSTNNLSQSLYHQHQNATDCRMSLPGTMTMSPTAVNFNANKTAFVLQNKSLCRAVTNGKRLVNLNTFAEFDSLPTSATETRQKQTQLELYTSQIKNISSTVR